MALTWAGVITILFLAAACVRGYRRGLIKELVSLAVSYTHLYSDWRIQKRISGASY